MKQLYIVYYYRVASVSRLKVLDRSPNIIRLFLPDILINLKNCIKINCLSILHKILHKVDHTLYCKLPHFAKPIRITQHTSQQKDKAFVLARCNTYQFSRCFTYSTIRLWNSLPNEVVLPVKQHRFVVLAKKIYVINNHY